MLVVIGVMGLSFDEKKRFLRALKEDEEFRYEVLGLLGIEELIRAVTELTREVTGLRQDISELRMDFNALRSDVGYIKTKADSLERRQEELIRDVGEVRKDMGEVKERLDKLDRTVENLSLGLEAEANSLVSNYLRQHGINIETGPVHLDSTYEFDIYGTNGQVTVVGEAKIRVSSVIIDRVVERVREAIKAFPDKFPGRVIIVVYCMRALPDAVEKAKELGVWLIEVGNERTPFPG